MKKKIARGVGSIGVGVIALSILAFAFNRALIPGVPNVLIETLGLALTWFSLGILDPFSVYCTLVIVVAALLAMGFDPYLWSFVCGLEPTAEAKLVSIVIGGATFVVCLTTYLLGSFLSRRKD